MTTMTSESRILNNRFHLLSQLGKGGMGSVWLAEDKLLERAVALKELAPDFNTDRLKESRARALVEARALARVKHPAIVRIHDVFFVGDDPWIVMEYINGRGLDVIMSRYNLDDRAVALIALRVIDGLGAVHGVNVVHRDVKPTNILVGGDDAISDDAIFLVDFGIAKIVGDSPLTGQAKVLGTRDYIAPERFLGREVGPAADFWSLGVTMFHALEGYSPFLRKGERGEEATMAAILNEDPPRPTKSGMLADVILRLLDKEPARRPKAPELETILRSVLGVQAAPVTKPEQPPLRKATPSPQPKPAHNHEAPRVHVANASQVVQSAGTDAGAAVLLGLPEDEAARILAGYRPSDVGKLLHAMAAIRPRTVGAIMQMLSLTAAGRALDYMSPGSAAPVLAGLPASEAVSILGRADVRTAAGVIMALASEDAVRLIEVMSLDRAASVLSYVRPATVAAVLHTGSADLNGKVLRQLSPSFRAQVIRHL